LERSYLVTAGKKSTGKVTVHRQGLYYRISCRCSLSGDDMYRLVVTCGSVQEKLGILVPKDGSFVLETSVPVKRIGEGDMSFSLLSKQEKPTDNFVPIYPEEPFGYISRLKESFLTHKDGQNGILVGKLQE